MAVAAGAISFTSITSPTTVSFPLLQKTGVRSNTCCCLFHPSARACSSTCAAPCLRSLGVTVPSFLCYTASAPSFSSNSGLRSVDMPQLTQITVCIRRSVLSLHCLTSIRLVSVRAWCVAVCVGLLGVKLRGAHVVPGAETSFRWVLARALVLLPRNKPCRPVISHSGPCEITSGVSSLTINNCAQLSSIDFGALTAVRL